MARDDLPVVDDHNNDIAASNPLVVDLYTTVVEVLLTTHLIGGAPREDRRRWW